MAPCAWLEDGISVRILDPPRFCNVYSDDQASCDIAYIRRRDNGVFTDVYARCMFVDGVCKVSSANEDNSEEVERARAIEAKVTLALESHVSQMARRLSLARSVSLWIQRSSALREGAWSKEKAELGLPKKYFQSFEDIVKDAGFDLEVHYVTTEDGYILKM